MSISDKLEVLVVALPARTDQSSRNEFSHPMMLLLRRANLYRHLLVVAALAYLPLVAEAALFEDQTEASGLRFEHFNGSSGEWYFPEINGSGVALFDYDQDGDLDVYLTQGAILGPGKKLAQAIRPPSDTPPRDRLFRNDLTIQDGQRRLRFTDVTKASGIDAQGYGMAVAAADFDNDGAVDLYVANYGANQLWRNRGDGTFEDVAEAWSADDRRWSSSLTVLDFDRDGWLDLYLGNYLQFEFATQKTCTAASGQRDYCHPSSYHAEENLLFRNGPGAGGQRVFADVTDVALPGHGRFPTLGSVAADFDGDGWLDIYVANDEQPNQLWRNRGLAADDKGRHAGFSEEALLSGCAVNGRGFPEASMGVAAGDFDADGDLDIFMSHLDAQTNTLFVNDGRGNFLDRTQQSGLGSASLKFTGFGTGFFDYDNDGWLDIYVVNGAVQTLEALQRQGDPYPYHQSNQLFHNQGGRFRDVSAQAGEAFGRSEVSRGSAIGDLDNDGDLDLVVINNSGPARVLINTEGQKRSWLGLRLTSGPKGRDLLGARATLRRGDQMTSVRQAASDGGYASSNDPRLIFGLGDHKGPYKVDILWPDGSQESFSSLAAGSYTTLIQGTGQTEEDRQ